LKSWKNFTQKIIKDFQSSSEKKIAGIISITSGTIFQGTRKPLMLWFNVIWQLISQKTGSSAQNIKESMDFGSYQTTFCCD